MIASLEQVAQRGQSAQARSERESVFGPLEGSQALLERFTGRISTAAVFVAGEIAWRELLKSCSQHLVWYLNLSHHKTCVFNSRIILLTIGVTIALEVLKNFKVDSENNLAYEIVQTNFRLPFFRFLSNVNRLRFKRVFVVVKYFVVFLWAHLWLFRWRLRESI